MSKSFEWKLNIDGIEHTASYQPRKKSSIFIDSEEIKFKRNFIAFFTGVDIPIKIGSADARFTTFNNKPDIAVNGYYLNSKKPYVPLSNIKIWGWVYIILCLLIFFIGFGGAIPVCASLLGIYFNVKVALSPSLKTSQKIVIGLLITLAAWLIFIFGLYLAVYLKSV